ncbi:MAG: hypothetical protein WCO29_05155 [Nostocales cyanobacterium ELA583]
MSSLPSLLLAQIYACAKQLPPATLETIIHLLATNVRQREDSCFLPNYRV